MSSKSRILFLAAAAGAALACGHGIASADIVQNGSFENNAPATGFYNTFAGNTLLNWTYVDGPAALADGGWEQSNQVSSLNFTPNTIDGSNHWITLRDDEAVYQDLGTTVQNNVTGNYSFSQGNQYNSAPGGVVISIWAGQPGALGSVELDSFDSPPDAATIPTVLAETITGTLDTGTLGSGMELYLEMQQDGTGTFGTGTVNNNVLVDDVTLTLTSSPVPEPASLGILSFGGLMLLRRRARVH